MSESILLCLNCLSLFKRHHLSEQRDGRYYCPDAYTDCFLPMVKLDENTAEVVKEFFSIRISIHPLNSCEGHIHKAHCPYLMFGEEIGTYDNLPVFHSMLTTMNERRFNSELRIDEIKECPRRRPGFPTLAKVAYKAFWVGMPYPRGVNSDIVERLVVKAKFVKCMKLFFEEVKKISW